MARSRGAAIDQSFIGMCQKFAGYTARDCRSAFFVVNFTTDRIR